MGTSIHLGRIALLGIALLLLAACGSGSTPPPTDAPPTVTVTEPAADLEIAQDMGGTVTIHYIDDDPDHAATTDLFADADGDLDTVGDQIVIAMDLPEMGGAAQSFDWDTIGAAAGTYRIVARTTGGSRSAVDTGPGLVQLNAAPTIAFASPGAQVRSARGGFVAAQLIADDGDDAATIWIYADVDGDPSTSADRTELASLLPEQDGATLDLCLGLAGLEVGTYTLLACIWDGTNTPVCVTAPGTVRIDDAAQVITDAGASHETYTDLAVHEDGTMTALCAMSGTTTFGAGQPGEVTFSTLGSRDPVLVRYDSAGTLQWARHIGGPGFDGTSGIGLRNDGSVVIAGELRSSLTFAMGEMNQTTVSSLGTSDIWVAHYNNDGSLDWVRTAGGAGTFDNPFTIEVLPDDTTLMVGRFGSTCTFGPGEANETMLTVAGDHDGFLAKFAANGDLIFARQLGGANFDEVWDVAALPGGSAFVTGAFQGTCTFGPGEAGEAMLTASGTSDMYVARYGANGDFQWVRAVTGSGNAGGASVTALSDGSFGASFSFDGEVILGPGEANETTLNSAGGQDGVVARYASNGDLQWARHVSSSGTTLARGIDAYKDNSLLVAVQTQATLTLGAGEPREQTVAVPGGEFVCAARYAADGTFQWVVLGEEVGSTGDLAFRAYVGPDSAGYLIGNFSGAMTFFSGETSEVTLPFNADQDAYIARFNADAH